MSEPAHAPAPRAHAGREAAGPAAAGAATLAGAGNAAVARLVERHSAWGMLDEEALGAELLGLALGGSPGIVAAALDELAGTDRDDVSLAVLERASDADLAGIGGTAAGRRSLDRMYDELTGGVATGGEREQAERILAARSRAIGAAGFAAQLERAPVFPFRLPGLTVLDDAPLWAERRGALVHVAQPVRVLGSDVFREETATLPAGVFTGGIDLAETQVVGVRMYDLGGPVVYRPALFLLDLAHRTDAQTLQKMAEVAGIALSLGAAEGIALGFRATGAARAWAIADAATAVFGTVAGVVLEHRGEIIARYGDPGRELVRTVEWLSAGIQLYGLVRVVLQTRLLARMRDALGRFRAGGGQLPEAERQIEEVLRAGERIAAERAAGGGAGAAELPAAEVPAPAGRADEAFEQAFAEHPGATGETYSGSPRLARGNFGERAATEALAADGYEIVSYKPGVEGTNQGGIDIVALRGDRVALVDNKALTRTGNVSSVSALTTNYAANLAAVRAEVAQALARPGIAAGERAVLRRTLDAIDTGRVDRIVTNANLAPDTVFPSGVTQALQSQGIRFLDVMR